MKDLPPLLNLPPLLKKMRPWVLEHFEVMTPKERLEAATDEALLDFYGIHILMEHFGIKIERPLSRLSLYLLCIQLARQCIPFFMYSKGRRGPKNDPGKMLDELANIEARARDYQDDESEVSADHMALYEIQEETGVKEDSVRRKRERYFKKFRDAGLGDEEIRRLISDRIRNP